MKIRSSFHVFLVAAASLAPSAVPAATIVWDGLTAAPAVTSADTFTYAAGQSASVGLTITTASVVGLAGDLTITGALSLNAGSGAGYTGIELVGASSTLTATSIALSGDVGTRNADGNSLALNTSAANGAIDLNVSLGRSGVWYIPSGFSAQAGTGTITVTGGGPSGNGWRSTPVTLTGGAINITAAVNSNAAVTLDNSLAGTISGILSGSMGLTKGGVGTMTMTARSTYTGATIVNAGTLRLNDARSLTGAVTVGAGATLTLENNANGGYYQPDSLTVNGGTVNAAVISANRYHGIYTNVIAIGGSGASSTISTPLFANKSGAATVINMGVTVAAGATGTIGGSIADHPDRLGANNLMTFSKAGDGTLVITSGANGFIGNVAITGGKLSMQGASGTAGGTNPTESALGNMTTAGRTITVDGPGAILEFNVADAIGAFGNNTPVMLIAKNGGMIARATTGGAFNSFGSITLQEGGILRANAGSNATVQSLSLNGNVTVLGTSLGGTIDAVAGTDGSNNGIHLRSVGSSGAVTFDVADTAATKDLAISARLLNPIQINYLGYNAAGTTAALLKTGAGRMDLIGTNAFSGGVTVRAGIVAVANNSGLGTGAVTLNDASTGSSDTALLIDATSGNVTVARPITVANLGNGIATLGSATTAGTNQAVFSGAVTLNKETTLSGGLAGDRLGFSGGIAGTANVFIAGSNRVVFAGTANTFAGTTTITAGANLQLSDGSATSASFLSDGHDITVDGALKLAKGGNAETIAGLYGSGTVSAIAGADTLVVGNGNASGSFVGTLADAGSTLALQKVGTGTQVLTGASTYTGSTTIANGTLELGMGASLGNTAVALSTGGNFVVSAGATVVGAVTVNSGATLTADGTLGAVNVNSGGTLRGSGSVGAVNVADGSANLVAGTGSAGTLTLASLSLAGAGTLTVGPLTGYTTTAAFDVTGTLGLGSTNVTLALPAGLVANGTYRLIAYGSSAASASQFTVSGPIIGARQFGGLSKDVTNKVFLYTIAGDSPVWTGANGTAFSGGNNWKLINASTTTDFLTNDALLLDDTAMTTVVNISAAAVSPAVLTFDNFAQDYTLQGSFGLASGAIVKGGSGNLTILNANTPTTVNITAGTLTLGNPGALGTAVVTLAGGSLDLNGQTTAASLVLAGGALTNTGTVNGVVSGGGALVKSSPGTLTLVATSTFSGGTTIANGVLALGHATDTLTNSGTVIVSGGELALGANSDAVGAVTLAGGAITGTGTLTAASLGLQLGTISAAIDGAGPATKSGTGTVTLSANNANYTGAVALLDGTLALGHDQALGTAAITLSGGDLALTGQTIANPLAFAGGTVSGSGTVSGAVSGAAAFTKSGTGALTLAGSQNPPGGISVTGGTLGISGSLNGGSYAGNIASNGSGALDFTGSTSQTLSGVISGSAGLAKSGGGTLTLSSGANTLTGDISVTGGTLRATGASAAAQSGSPITSSLGNMTVVRAITVGSGATLEIVASDAIGAYNYLTPVMLIADGGTIAAGLAPVGTSGNFRSIGNLTLRNGGGLVTANGNAPINNNVTNSANVGSFALNGNVTVDGSSAMGATISPEATQTFQNFINLGTVSGGTTFTVAETNDAATADLTVSTILANTVLRSAIASLTKDGAGRMVLTAGNYYQGSTIINAGTLALANGGGLYRGGYTATTLTVAPGATLQVETWNYNESTGSLGGLSANASSLVVNGGTLRVSGAAATSHGRGVTVQAGGVTLDVAAGANWTIDTVNDSQAWVYNGSPSVVLTGTGTGAFQKTLGLGAGSLAKTGVGTWTLSGANSFTGGTSVSAGTLIVGHVGALGSGAVNVSGGTLDLNNLAPANAISISGGTLLNAGAWASAGVLNLSGSTNASFINSLPTSEVNVGVGSTVDLNGVTKNVVFEGGTLANLATYAARLKVKTALDLSANAPLGEIEVAGGGAVDFGNTVSNRTLKYSGGTVAGANFTGNVEVAGAAVTVGAGIQAGTVRVTPGSGAVVAAGFARDISFAGGSLSGLGNYTRTVSLETGATLSIAEVTTAGVILAAGSTLKGTGTVGTLRQLAGSTLAPGSSPGMLTSATTILAGGSEMQVEFFNPAAVAGVGYDAVTTTNLDLTNLSSASRYTLRLVSLSGLPATQGALGGFDDTQAYSFDIFDYTTIQLPGSHTLQTITGLFFIDATAFQDSTGSSVIGVFDLVNDAANTTLSLTYSPVPEPSTYGLMLGSLALAIAAVRRRRKRP